MIEAPGYTLESLADQVSPYLAAVFAVFVLVGQEWLLSNGYNTVAIVLTLVLVAGALVIVGTRLNSLIRGQ